MSEKIKPKKSLGQNWLTSETAIKKIVSAGQVSEKDTILEIGPGQGALTSALLETGAKIVAIEKDRRLISDLKEKFQTEIKRGQLVLIESDILKVNPKHLEKDVLGKPYKLVANIPYYITGEIIRKFLETDQPPELMVILVQKEVAKRIIAKDKKESILSISVKAYGEPKYIDTVKAGSFYPKPKVDSAILLIEKINKKNFKDIKEKDFFALVKKGFSQKRKLLKSNLGCKKEIFDKCGLKEKARAEDISLDDWICLTKEINAKNK